MSRNRQTACGLHYEGCTGEGRYVVDMRGTANVMACDKCKAQHKPFSMWNGRRNDTGTSGRTVGQD